MKLRFKLIFLSLVALMVSIGAEAQKFDRGISLTEGPMFMPKGQMIFGGTVSYQDYKFYDFDFLILDEMNLSAFTFKVSPNVYYSFAKNMAVGVRFSYKRTMAKIDAATLAISSDIAFSINDFYSIQHTYYGSLAYRYYMPIGSSKRFGLFADIMLSGGAGQGKIVSGTGADVTGTFQDILELGIDVVPGIVVFMSNEVSVEASVGILGLTYKKISQTKNQIYEGMYETSSANFKINFLSIGLGVNFVIPISKEKLVEVE